MRIRQSFISLGLAGLQCSGVFMVVSTVDPGLQELQRYGRLWRACPIKKNTLGCEVSSDVTLLDYLRNYLQLRGTKYMCREGGCGACMVTAAKSPGTPHVAVNSVRKN
uniref:SFRICE_014762 n=1 Tax=Spodoptera frugiperda TaxID=7108 RepID=A0A2H1VFA4_SPOFR